MAERSILNPTQAKEVEEQLFSTLRQQVGRSVPMPLPRSDFWKKVGELLDTIEMDIHTTYKTVGNSLKLQTLQKRQANVRRTATELARKRMVALMQHSASMALRTEGGGQGGQDLAAMDWSRHDPAEREFYSNATEQLNKFKQAVNWNSIQMGISSEELDRELRMAPGTTQLDSFVAESGGLTGQGPPTIALEDNQKPLEEAFDDEELLAKADEFPELAGAQPIEEVRIPDAVNIENHAAAMELAPSKKKEEMDFAAWAAADAESEIQSEPPVDDTPEPMEGELLRIRITKSLDEPIITIDGEITLGAGDVLFLDEMTANYLVESGVAEVATL